MPSSPANNSSSANKYSQLLKAVSTTDAIEITAEMEDLKWNERLEDRAFSDKAHSSANTAEDMYGFLLKVVSLDYADGFRYLIKSYPNFHKLLLHNAKEILTYAAEHDASNIMSVINRNYTNLFYNDSSLLDQTLMSELTAIAESKESTKVEMVLHNIRDAASLSWDDDEMLLGDGATLSDQVTFNNPEKYKMLFSIINQDAVAAFVALIESPMGGFREYILKDFNHILQISSAFASKGIIKHIFCQYYENIFNKGVEESDKLVDDLMAGSSPLFASFLLNEYAKIKLQYFVRKGDIEQTTALIEEYFNTPERQKEVFEYTDPQGKNILHLALTNDASTFEMMDLILSMNPSHEAINLRDNEGISPLDLQIMLKGGIYAEGGLLIAEGASLVDKNSDGENSITWLGHSTLNRNTSFETKISYVYGHGKASDSGTQTPTVSRKPSLIKAEEDRGIGLDEDDKTVSVQLCNDSTRGSLADVSLVAELDDLPSEIV